MQDKTSFLKRPLARPAQAQSTQHSSMSPEGCVAELANELMNARTSFHKLHLKVTGMGSFASHSALNELYDALPGNADSLIEQYQGATEMLIDMPDSTPRTLGTKEEGIQYIREIKDQVAMVQSKITFSEIVNDLDLIKSTLNSIKYKLLFLS